MAKASFNEPNPVPNITGWHDLPSFNNVERKNLASVFETDDKNSIQIYLRLRPNSSNDQTEENFKIIDSKTVEVTAPPDSVVSKSNRSGNADEVRYIFSEVFEPRTSQKVLFNSCVLNSVHNFINTKSCLLFSYGTTNAGKTHTVHGSKEEPGIIPRVLSILFRSIKSKQTDEYQGVKFRPEYGNSVRELSEAEIKDQISMKAKILNCPNDSSGVDLFQSANTHITDSSYAFSNSAAPSEFSQMEDIIDDEIISVENEGNMIYAVWVSFLEVYNESVYDLLMPPTSEKRVPLKIAQDRGRNYFVKGLRHVHVTSGIEAYKVLLVGKNNLQVASTNLNRSSSRSHCVFSIKLIKRENIDNPSIATLSSFSICDLAGAERLEKTGNTGSRMKETQNINTSLHVLVRCFKTMLDNQSRPSKPEVVPYRDSKLTQLFHRQLSGKFNEDVIMIVNVNPSPKLFEETAFVLKASAIAKQIIKKPILKHRANKRKSMFSTLVYENKNRETIPWEGTEETAKVANVDLEQLYQEFELEKQKIREECEEERLRSVTILDNMIQEMIQEQNQQLKETRDLYTSERLRREKLYRDCITELKAEIAALTGEQNGSSSSSSSGYNSDLNIDVRSLEKLELSLQEANQEKLELKSNVSLLKTQNKELGERIKTLQNELNKVTSLEEELREKQQNTEKLKKLLDEARIDLLESDEDKSLLQETLAQAHAKIDDLTYENKQLKKIIGSKNEVIELLENDIDGKNYQIESLKNDIVVKSNSIATLTSDFDQLQQQYDTNIISHDRLLNKIEEQRDKEKKKNAKLEEKIENLTLNFSKLQSTDSENELQNLKLQVEKLKRANEEKDAEHQKTIDDITIKYERKLKEVRVSLEKSEDKQKARGNAKKQSFDFDGKENEPVFQAKSEPRPRIRTRNQIKSVIDKSMNVRRSKSSDSRVLLSVQFPDTSVNRTPSPKGLSDVERPMTTKSCKKKLYNCRDFVDIDIEPIKFNPLTLSSPKSELKSVKRRLRNQYK